MSKANVFCSATVRGEIVSKLRNHLQVHWASPTLHIFMVLLGMSMVRVYSLEMASRTLLDCAGCLGRQSLIFELRFLLLASAAHILGQLHTNRGLRLIARVGVCVMLLLYAVDLVLLQQLHIRLSLDQVKEFHAEYAAMAGFAKQSLGHAPWASTLAIGFVAGLGVAFFRYLVGKQLVRGSPLLALITSAGVVLTGYAEPVNYHLYYLQNPMEAFFSAATRNTPYTPAFHKGIAANPRGATACTQGLGERPNIILVVVESLSMYHSKLFSGINDWTPEFDEASRNGRRFSNFYANGITTEQGLVSILTGEPPIEKGLGGGLTIFEQFEHPADTIPRMLNGLDYQTAFLTTGNLGFLNKGAWLSKIGFSFTEGHDAHFYDGMKRYQFDAAPDDALYDRSLQKIAQLQNSSNAPIFMVLETVTTHAPYVDPTSGNISQEQVFRYADHALGNYIQALKARGFFDNGYVMVMGDHRAMTPAKSHEMTAFGDQAYARLPFSIIGKHQQSGVESTSFSQTDVLPSLRHWLGRGTQCNAADQGVFLPTALKAPACIFTRRSYAQNNVYAQCETSDYTLLLDGDETRFTGAMPGDASLLQEVHALRLNRGFPQGAATATSPTEASKRLAAVAQNPAF